MAKENDKCNFCGRQRKDVALMITGEGVNICDVCVHSAGEIVKENLASKKDDKFNLNKEDLPKPREIKSYLDTFVIGQD
jgi:ATP-dependent Clp protease ATP-binding subunit ClpX